jgi:hypothetical protein
MADKCRELPRGPRGALLSSFPPCLVFPHTTKEWRARENPKTSEVPDISPNGFDRLVIMKKTKEEKKSEMFCN